jgi:four helix bundle protein
MVDSASLWFQSVGGTAHNTQLNRSAGRVAPLIAEGFGQLTDKHFAVYVARARGSALESCTAAELGETVGLFHQVGKMATSLIRYLQKTDRKQRG